MINSIYVGNISKKFKLSRKQQIINKTKDTYKIAVNNLTLTAYSGEIYGLLGSNGAGKTTTLRMIATLLKPEHDGGFIKFDDKELSKNLNFVRENIAFLTSELKLEGFFTPNYLFDFYANLRNIDVDRREKRKKYLFDKFGINNFAEVKIDQLSTGMKQKASLAISLLHDPDVIIFDEPTNGLDVLTAKIVTDYLLELKNEGKLIIVSSHIFSLIEKISDRVGIIINGQMSLEGKLRDITCNNILEDVFFELYSKNAGGQ